MNLRDALRTVRLLLVALVLVVAPAVQVAAQTCGDWDNAQAILLDRYGEAVVSFGLQSNGAMLAITATPDGSTWTAMVVRADGVACLMAAGEAWSETAPIIHIPGEEF